jgi:hypothetical protein
MNEYYCFGYYEHLNLEYWENRTLRFYDAFPALNYAYGIGPHKILNWMFHDLKMRQGWSIEQQIEIIQRLKTRTPESVFEIGAGRGELICTFQHLGANVDSCEVNAEVSDWFHKTGQHFFGHRFRPKMPIIGPIQNHNINWANYDTIVMVESLEHIEEQHFKRVWANIVRNFKGLFIVTNYSEMHPIPVGGNWENAEKEHCRLIDDSVYDEMARDAKQVVVRKGSHLVLEF